MIRALVALFFVCLVVGGVVLDQDLHLLYPSFERMLGVLIVFSVVAVPGFLFLVAARSVQWWQLTAGALLIAALYMVLAANYGVGLASKHGMIYGPFYLLWLAVRCTVASCLFWLAGIWRNPRFPDVARRLPIKSFAVLLPTLAAAALGIVWLAPMKLYGHVIESSELGQPKPLLVAVRLLDGRTIRASMQHASAPTPQPRRCVELNTRRSLTSPQWRSYWIENTYQCDTKAKPTVARVERTGIEQSE